MKVKNAKNDETIEIQFGDTAKVEDLIKKIKSEEMVTHVKMTEVFKKNFPTTDMQTPKNNAGYKFFKYYELASDHHVHVWGYQFPQVSNQPQSANTSNTSAAVVDDSLFAHHCEVKLNNKEIEEAITNTIPSAQSEFKEWSNAQDAKEANINQANANNVAVPQNSSNSSPKVSQISDQSNNNPNPSTIVSKKSENSLSQSQNGSLSQIPQKNSLVGSNLEGSRGSEVN